MSGIRTLLVALMLATVNVNFGNATTVRHVYEWSYYTEADYHILRYVHEIWDVENYGFTIRCQTNDKTFLTIDYEMFSENYFNQYKRKKMKPKMEIRSNEGHVTAIGDLDESDMYPLFVFQILQFPSNDVLKILASADAEIIFPNRSFKIWQIKKSSEISSFLSACAARQGQH